jgi:hypothetical protein
MCIGMPRAGTRWLYDQLKHHPECWMPPIKELRFFHRAFPREADLDRIHAQETDDPRSVSFLKFVQSLADRKVLGDMAVYDQLFDFAGGSITGDITPSYGALPDDVIAAIASRYPALKVVLLLRNPISRLWSAANNAVRRGRGGIDEGTLTLAGIAAFLEDDRVRPLCFPTAIYARWSRHFPTTQLRYFFLDDLIAAPEAARADVLGFIGADPSLRSGDLPPGYNSKTIFSTPPMSGEIARFLGEIFESELAACAQTFGGAAQRWSST